MKRYLLRALAYAVAALAIVICYTETRTFGEIELTLQDESGRIVTNGFPAILAGSYSNEMTVVRNGHICHYEFKCKTVLRHGRLGVALNYRGTRDGEATTFTQTIPFSTPNSSSGHWVQLDDHLLACASLR